MRISVRFPKSIACLALLLTFTARADEPLVPEKTLGGLLNVSRDLAKAGLGDEAEEILSVLADLGMPSKRIEDRRKANRASAERARRGAAAKARPRAVKAIRREVALLAAFLEGERAKRVAEILIRLDGDCEPARLLLGHERVDGAWLGPEERSRHARRVAFHEALALARRLPVGAKIEGEPSPIVKAASGVTGAVARVDGIELHGPQDPVRLIRMLEEARRATAVVQFILHGKLEKPKLRPARYIVFARKESYLRALDTACAMGRISEKQRKEAEGFSWRWWLEGGLHVIVSWKRTEVLTEAILCTDTVRWSEMGRPDFDMTQACLRASVLNLACIAYLGASIPTYAWLDATGSGKTKGAARDEDELMRLYPQAGLIGHRRRMVYLARDGRDPAFATTIVDQFGELQGDELIKATSVVEYLREIRGALWPLMAATAPGRGINTGVPTLRVFERELGQDLSGFEGAWRRWLLEGDAGESLVHRLGGAPEAPLRSPSPEEAAAVAYLNRLRAGAGLEEPIGADPELSADARRHAEYLTLNPGQLAKWPEAHEEFPDRPGYSPQGSWAGGHSVIMPGNSTARAAIDGWLGTFYHRLPLIHPGLLMIGWGAAERATVLDASSLSIPPQFESRVLWPHDGMRSVPRRFRPELPNPVPGEDQSAWGYPVTFQVWPLEGDTELRVRMTLRKGSPSGPEVDCHFSTPDDPTNPELAPAASWCLIPKSHLDAKTRYFVVADTNLTDWRVTWSFITR